MTRVFGILMVVFMAGAAQADPVVGVWRTGPDAKGQVADVQVTSCGAALCGMIVRSYDRSGAPVTSPNIGRRVFWDMAQKGGGSYKGRAFVPAHNREYAAGMQLSGRKLTVKGCLGPICQSQVWTRVN